MAWVAKTANPNVAAGVGHGSFGYATIGSKIYLIGGRYAVGSAQPECYYYDMSTDSWTQIADMPDGRTQCGVAVIGGKLYVAGGLNSAAAPTNTLYEYDPTLDTWLAKTVMPISNYNMAFEAVGAKAYAIGGWLGSPAGQKVYEYNANTDTWSVNGNMPEAIAGMGAKIFQNKVHIFGGLDPATGNAIASHWVYDPSGDSWAAATALPATRRHITCGGGERYALLVGGDISGTAKAEAWRYDASDDSFTAVTNYVHTVYRAAVGANSDGFYVTSGESGGGTQHQDANLWEDTDAAAAFSLAIGSGATITTAPEELPHRFTITDFPGIRPDEALRLVKKLNQNFDSIERQLLALEPEEAE